MEAYLAKACWRAGAKLIAGFAVLGAVVGIRVVTATPTGIEAEIAELERFEAEQAAEAVSPSRSAADSEGDHDAAALATRSSGGMLDGSSAPVAGGTADTDQADLDRMVRCHLAGQTQFMRAADCGTRGGALEELPPPEPEDPTATESAP
ncbi:MAG: hypothetical protein IPK00_01510 [Deltaproteobacteria bacterium]|nr:hypothetical protein [Deltaproteobacteria bacterium]